MEEREIRRLVREQLEESVGGWIKKQAQSGWQKTKDFGQAVKRETKETLMAAKIFGKLLKKQEPTPEEIKFLKGQGGDLAKALVLLGLQAVPGSSLAVIGIEKFLKKHGMTMFPQSQTAEA